MVIKLGTWNKLLTIHLDIDECMFSNGGCDQVCTNSNGSFECSCEKGFLLDVNRFICNGENIWYKYMKYLSMKYNVLDINECSEGLDMCSYNASCTNTEGGYNCSCEFGYHGDGLICNSNIITTIISGIVTSIFQILMNVPRELIHVIVMLSA